MRGNALRSDRNSCISLSGVPMLVNSASVRFSTSTFLPSCMEGASCMWNPNHICPIISISRVAARLDLVLDVALFGIVEVAV